MGGPHDETVALYDESGRECGSAPRSQVRRDNLRHGATSVLVRNSYGEIYLHRRSAGKDVYPGMYDCLAGGLLRAGEDPLDGAVRELAEELGITGVQLRPLLHDLYHDEVTCYWAFGYEVSYDGPVTWQPDEVDAGGWVTLEELARRLQDSRWPFVPDSRALVGPWLAERLADRRPTGAGWDSRASDVEGRWTDREPRRPEVAQWLLAETEVMPWLAPLLPVAVPVPRVVERAPLRVRHPTVPGDPIDDTAGPGHAVALARFLQTLGTVPTGLAEDHGVRPADLASGDHERFLDEARDKVLGFLPDGRVPAAERLLETAATMPFDTVVHGDIGPAHVLVQGDRLSGVIDWSDVHVGDRARDLAWALYDTPRPFADAFARSYGLTDALTERARIWYRLGPWYEVLHGLARDRPDLVDSGLCGVLDRLEPAPAR